MLELQIRPRRRGAKRYVGKYGKQTELILDRSLQLFIVAIRIEGTFHAIDGASSRHRYLWSGCKRSIRSGPKCVPSRCVLACVSWLIHPSSKQCIASKLSEPQDPEHIHHAPAKLSSRLAAWRTGSASGHVAKAGVATNRAEGNSPQPGRTRAFNRKDKMSWLRSTSC